jgi:uncharacterized protein (TIGR00299 family) protein
MLLGALIDLGLPEDRLREELSSLNVKGYELIVKRVEKQGISATYVDVKTDRSHHHRHLPDIYKIIDNSGFNDIVKETSKKVFWRLAEAEAKVHGTTPEHIHFHEVGAVDAIVDIVGGVFGLNYLGIEQIYASRLTTGTGFVQCSHGLMPVPAPATAELLTGIPYIPGEIAKELVTPTGAALLSTLAVKYGSLPEGFITEQIGYGAGTWDLDIPNVLRAFLGNAGMAANKTEYLMIEANIDDLNPQVYPYVIEKLLSAGARDAWTTPITMKKGRPAVKLSVLADKEIQPSLTAIIFAETSSIGMRYYQVNREEAERKIVEIQTQWGLLHAKVSYFQGEVCNIAPEYEDCRQIADELGIPLKTVWQEVLKLSLQLYGETGR